MIWQTKLQEAVQLAGAGQKAEAYQLLKEVIQLNPNEKKAWLWLANVTPDRGEYERALREVLRLDPSDPLAQQGLAFLQQQQQQQQYSAPPQGTPPYTPPPAPAPYSQQPPYTPPPAPAPYAPAPTYGAPVGQPPAAQRGYAPYGAPLAPVEVEVRTSQKRRSCLGCAMPGCFGCLGCGGCGQGCLLALVVLIIAPIVLCAGLSYTNYTLGPLDVPAAYLPGEFGRKEITFEAPIEGQTYDVTAKVSRSWYVADPDDDLWTMWRDGLNDGLPFEDTTTTWTDLDMSPGQVPNVVNINPVDIAEGGTLSGMGFVKTAAGDYRCAAVRTAHSANQPVSYSGGLCGYRTTTTTPWSGGVVFKSVTAPTDIRQITFYVPLDQDTAAQWQISLPEKLYSRLKPQIDTTIESMKITLK